MCTSMLNESQQKPKERKEDSTQGEYAYFRLPGSAGGGVAPRRNNRITESATKESREAKVKAKKAIQESNGKRQDEMTIERKKNKEWDTENDKKRRGKKRRKKRRKKGKKKRKTVRKGVRAIL